VSEVVALATAARAAGVTHLRMRVGPVRELILLPPDPPADPSPAEATVDLELQRREREARLRGGS
jgi:hypothetical protein